MRIPSRLLPHTILLKPYLGSGAYGDVWGDPITVERANVEQTNRLVRTTDSREVVSSTTVYLEPRDVPEGSLVTVWVGTPHEHESKVVSVKLLQHPRGLSHLTLYLE